MVLISFTIRPSRRSDVRFIFRVISCLLLFWGLFVRVMLRVRALRL